MKSIKAIDSLGSGREKRNSPLASIQQPLFRSKRERVQVPCAFHSSELITNFCKHSQCLLPLCPRCVKIHIEEHAGSGTLARFQAIEDCLDQVHAVLIDSFSHATRLQRVGKDMEEAYARKKQEALQQLEQAKTVAYDMLASIFRDYEDTLRRELSKDDKGFNQGLVEYNDCVTSIVDGCRVSTKKFNNKSTLMEGLISFYSKQDLNAQMRLCEQKLNKIVMTKIQIVTQPHELQKLTAVIRKYIHFGETAPPNPSHSRKRTVQIPHQKNRETQERATGQSGEVFIQGQQKLVIPDVLTSLKTPLDSFSLERSRGLRRSINRTRHSEAQP